MHTAVAVAVLLGPGQRRIGGRQQRTHRRFVGPHRQHSPNSMTNSVSAVDIAGDVRGRPAVIIDDMITTGTTIEAAVELLRERGAAHDIVVAATHGLLVHAAASRLHELELRRVLVTDTVAVKTAGTLIRVCSIAPTVADAIACLHTDKPLHEPAART